MFCFLCFVFVSCRVLTVRLVMMLVVRRSLSSASFIHWIAVQEEKTACTCMVSILTCICASHLSRNAHTVKCQVNAQGHFMALTQKQGAGGCLIGAGDTLRQSWDGWVRGVGH